MATLREYFDRDFAHLLKASDLITIQFSDGPPTKFQARVHFDFDGNAKYISCYFSPQSDPLKLFVAILQHVDKILAISDGVGVLSGYIGEPPIDISELVFTGRVFFYSETDIVQATFEQLRQESRQKGLAIRFRGPGYAVERSKLDKPLAFLCHDSRDKEAIARPLALELYKLMCPVWYDEYSLKVGDRLRESIENGVKECKKCVLVISNHFLSNTGWTRTEFDSIFTRELIEKTDFSLPIWAGVTKEQVYRYSPSLANRFALDWSLGAKEVAARLCKAIRTG